VELLEERRKQRERVIKQARRWALKLPFKVTAVLVGSYARGDFNLWSDVDILLISNLRGNPLERLAKIDFSPGFQVIPLTPEEFTKQLERGDPLAVEAIKIGVVLRDDFKLLKRLRGGRGKPGL